MRRLISFPLIVFLFLITARPCMAQQKARAVINHIAHYVIDLKKSTDFYMNIVGLDTIPEPFHDGKHSWFSIGVKSHLHLISGMEKPVNDNKHIHLCFSVPDMDAFVKVLEKNGIEFEDWPGVKNKVTARVDGVKQIYFKDPDGYWLEINDAKE